MAELAPRERYKLVVSTVVPRPIAWVTTVDRAGVVNAAPYSFFNAMGDDPPLLVLGLMKDGATGGDKDTATNIFATGEFVVNLVCEADAGRMVETSAPVPRGQSEVDYAGLTTAPSSRVKPPRIATAPVSFECVRREMLEIGPGQVIAVGEIVVAHVADAFVTDPQRLHLDTAAMGLIARMHGADTYLRSTDRFHLARPAFDPARLGPGDQSR
ncbi:flavin reductase family protein [Novosphingobium flavum]|uniref:Flavin reductase family protein n=1 Tax=Novosphingobium aerophilum TaxID=2839843 RepID=A0A7X1F599_9SPHN|nr:flavin reductase family protein [Novosphingobium aerophilum]MBC2650657.1 flavin reductase family protein [Novosphingobium aerophilum]MBC2662180.1 flavin reductase family protein [Novosphingobium aerophilum]